VNRPLGWFVTLPYGIVAVDRNYCIVRIRTLYKGHDSDRERITQWRWSVHSISPMIRSHLLPSIVVL
jgi:hypothetical protein